MPQNWNLRPDNGFLSLKRHLKTMLNSTTFVLPCPSHSNPWSTQQSYSGHQAMYTNEKKSKELSWNYYIFKTTKQISFNSVQSLSHVWLFVTPWTTACQASLSITDSQNLLKLTSIKRCHPTILSSVVPFSSHLQSFPASGSFPMSQLFTSDGQNIGASASALVLPMMTDFL